MSRRQTCLDYAIAKKRLMKLNVFVKLNEQKTNLFGLCHSEKTTNEIERFCQAK